VGGLEAGGAGVDCLEEDASESRLREEAGRLLAVVVADDKLIEERPFSNAGTAEADEESGMIVNLLKTPRPK